MNKYHCPICGGELIFVNDTEYEYYSCFECTFLCDHLNLVPDFGISNREIDMFNVDSEILNRIVRFRNKMLKNDLNFNIRS
ncbi:MAG: hypothetical protein MJB14_05570 [Spirochaetes bacterium]|nr:hypothetical protein [Spirochaetota bacterium]